MIYRKLSITLNPYQLYQLINREYEFSFLLESLDGEEKLARFSFIGFDPKNVISANKKIITIDGQEHDAQNPIRALAHAISKKKIEKEGFAGGAVGYFSYDYVRNLESISEKIAAKSGFPDFEFGIFDDCIIYDHKTRAVYYLSHSEDRLSEITSLAKEDTLSSHFETGNAKASLNRDQFEKIVEIAKERIRNGEIFQVVLSRKYTIPFEGSLMKFYNYLKQTNPSPYMFFLNFGQRSIVGSSPENLVRVEGRKIDSFATLAGTMPRGKTPQEDSALEQQLLSDEKEKAEHLMLVDLTRNDVGKVAAVGSVSVPELMCVHKYKYVQHLSSHIEGMLADGKDCFDVFDALFPAGTLTGAPKVRAMEIIEELEKDRRGPYGGAVGYFSFNGNCDFGITIRTLVALRKKAFVQAGAGIVYDSIPAREYDETEHKMRALMRSLEISTNIKARTSEE
ncbi:MAG: anthranilate synthase component I [Candidatus Micrarchaeota archaeon]